MTNVAKSICIRCDDGDVEYITLFTLEYEFTDTFGPRCTDVFNSNLIVAYILPI